MSEQTLCKDCAHAIWREMEKAVATGEWQAVWTSSEDGWICPVTGDEHAPVPPFTGVPGYEHDQAGRPMCGHDFMAGTICSDEREHEGPHSARCQGCGGDWLNGTCTCTPSADPDTDLWDDVCSECGGALDDGEGYDGLCGTCADAAENGPAMDPEEAVTLGIFAINTFLEPTASSAEDCRYLDENAQRALTMLVRVREWMIAQGEDFIESLDANFSDVEG